MSARTIAARGADLRPCGSFSAVDPASAEDRARHLVAVALVIAANRLAGGRPLAVTPRPPASR